MPGPPGMDSGAAPMTNYGGGSFFSQDLGTVLRLQYRTESYGQYDRGNFDIGSMKVFSFDGSTIFIDGQVTLNEEQGVGYNIGTGYRWLTNGYASDAGRMQGVSLWTDGTSTDEGNFFPQIGLSLESLGDMWDFRANGYLPLGPETQQGNFEGTGLLGFQGNSISELTQAVVNTSYAVADLEAARRLGSERDAWAFAGPYFVGNDDDDAVGYRLGVRGYAYPDLLLQVAVTDDEIFKTNATFSVTWFVGRTRTDFQPTCGVPDRFREPVMRNDYVALSRSVVTGGEALTNPDGTALRFVHVDSNAADGGDGTFENPFNLLTDVNGGGSLAGDIILAHAQSVFTGEATVVLKDDQRLLGEGNNEVFTVATEQRGIIDIPETAPGARALARPMILNALGDVVQMANDTEFANFDIEDAGGSAAIGTGLTGNANIHDLAVTGGGDFAVSMTGNATTSTVTLDDFTYDGEAGPAGGVLLDDFDGTFNATDSTFTNGTLAGLAVRGDTDGGITFADTTTFTSIDGTTIDINGDVAGVDQLGGRVTINSDITNDTERSVSVQNVATNANIDFTGDITDTGRGILVNSNSGGTVTFMTGTVDLEIDTAGETAVLVTDNTGATVEFIGPVEINNTNDAAGLVATGGGTLRYSNTANAISTQTGRVVHIEDMTIATQGVVVSDLSRDVGANQEAVLLRDNTGGPITLGDVTESAGGSGTLVGGNADVVLIENSSNVTLSAVTINTAGGTNSGVVVRKNSSGTQTVNLNDLDINDGEMGIEIVGGGAGVGALSMSVNDTTIDRTTANGIRITNVDVTGAGGLDFNNVDLDGNNVSGGGVLITDTNGTVDFDSASEIREFDGTDFEVANGAGTVNFAGDIVNAGVGTDTTGRSVFIHDNTGGSVTFTAASSITDDNDGLLVEDNSGGVYSFLGTNDFDTGANDAVTVQNNTGDTDVVFNNLDIDTTTGDGVVIAGNDDTVSVNINGVDVNTTSGTAFNATGGGDLTVGGNNNVIVTTTGTGVLIDGMNIVTQALFESVTVNGATNGIVLRDVTGSQITIGESGGAQNSGGTLTTIGDAIVIENVANVDLFNQRVTNAGGEAVNIDHSAGATGNMDVTINGLNLDASTGDGINVAAANDGNVFNFRLLNGDLEENVNIDVTGSSDFNMLVDNNDIDVTGTVDAFSLSYSGSAGDSNVTFRNQNDFAADDGSALDVTSSGATAKGIDMLVQDSAFNSTSATDPAASFVMGGNTLFNITVQGNVFDDGASGGEDFYMESSGAQSRIRLNLGGDDTEDFNTASGTGDFVLFENGGDFDVFERDDTFNNLRNNGTVDPQPNAAAFDDTAVAPPLPVVP